MDTDDKMMIPTTPKNPTPSEVGHAYCGEVSFVTRKDKIATYSGSPFNKERASGCILGR